MLHFEVEPAYLLTKQSFFYDQYSGIFLEEGARPYRFFYSIIAIPRAFSSLSFAALPDLLLLQTQELESISLLAESVGLPKEDKPALSSVMPPTFSTLIAALALWGMQKRDVASLIALWKQASLKDNEVTKMIVDIDDYWSSMTPNIAERSVCSNASDYSKHQLAAVYLLTSGSASPRASVYAQAGLFLWFEESVARDLILPSLPIILESFSRTWMHHINEPALLRHPALSVADINAALSMPNDSIEKLICLLDAGAYATGVPIFDGWKESLRRLSKSESFN